MLGVRYIEVPAIRQIPARGEDLSEHVKITLAGTEFLKRREKLEKELLEKELRFRGRQEHEIKKTRFRLIRKGDRFEPIVVEQQLIGE